MSKESNIGVGDLVPLVLVGGVLYAFHKFTSGPTVTPTPPLLPDDLPPPPVGESPTMTRAAARILADRVFAAIYAGVGEDEEAVIAAMLPPRNTADVLLVLDEYGARRGPWWSPVEYTLPGALRAFLSAKDVARINTDYARRGINVRF